jgi:hypothetical protein
MFAKMIVEKGKLKSRDYVTRVCDDCGDEAKRLYGSLTTARKKRGNEKDYCKTCSYKYRRLEQPTMENSPSWNGGRYLNENGYYRVYTGNLKYEYEHKLIMGEHLGKKISREEKVHHIDLDKTNNSIENLYLFKNKSEHSSSHYSLERCGFSFFGSEIWFDGKSYTLDINKRLIRNINVEIRDILQAKTYVNAKKGREYGHYKFTNKESYKKFGSYNPHIAIAERTIKRKMFRDEIVHHIDGNPLNNDPENLIVMKRKCHTECHYSMQICAIELFKKEIIKFKGGFYYVK